MRHRKPSSFKIRSLPYKKIKALENHYSSGYEIDIFNKEEKTYPIESYNWPLTVKMVDNYAKKK